MNRSNHPVCFQQMSFKSNQGAAMCTFRHLGASSSDLTKCTCVRVRTVLEFP